MLHGRPDRIRLSALPNPIRLLPNPLNPSRNHMPPFRPPPVQKLSILEFILRTQMILRQHYGVGLELFGVDWLASQAIKDLR